MSDTQTNAQVALEAASRFEAARFVTIARPSPEAVVNTATLFLTWLEQNTQPGSAARSKVV